MSPSLARVLLQRDDGSDKTQLLYGVATGHNTVTIGGSTAPVTLPALSPVTTGDYVAVLAAGADRLILGAISQTSVSWTPVLTQSNAIAISGNDSYYSIHGDWVIGRFKFQVATGQTGTANNAIKISLPVPPDTVMGSIGVGSVYDDSAGKLWPGMTTMFSTTEMWIADSTTSGGSWALGACPAFNLALAQNDSFDGSFMYRRDVTP